MRRSGIVATGATGAAVLALGAGLLAAGGDGAPAIDEDRLPEARVVRAAGGEVVLLPLTPGHSTSGLVERIQAAGGAGGHVAGT